MEIEHRLTLPDGRTLACLETGDPSGSPAIYLHGYPGSRFEVRVLADAAERLHVRLLAPDRPGFGHSTFQPGRTISSSGADIQHLADAFGWDRFAVIGLSGGGPHALACGARMRHRISRIALVSGVAPATRELVADMITPYRLALLAGARMPALARFAIASIVRAVRSHPERLFSPILVKSSPADRKVLGEARYRNLMKTSLAESLRQAGRHVAHELTLLARPWDIRLEKIGTPVTIWQGLADNIVPPAMARYHADTLASSVLRCLPDEGHLSILVRHADRVLADLARAHQ